MFTCCPSAHENLHSDWVLTTVMLLHSGSGLLTLLSSRVMASCTDDQKNKSEDDPV